VHPLDEGVHHKRVVVQVGALRNSISGWRAATASVAS
jgi:hypothetical protein